MDWLDIYFKIKVIAPLILFGVGIAIALFTLLVAYAKGLGERAGQKFNKEE